MKGTIWDEGYWARGIGMRESENPYCRDNETAEYCMWLRGFNARRSN